MKSLLLVFILNASTANGDSNYDDYDGLYEPQTTPAITLSEALDERVAVNEPVFLPCETKDSNLPVICGRIWRQDGRVLFQDEVKMDVSDPMKLHSNGTLEISFPETGLFLVECATECFANANEYVVHYVEVVPDWKGMYAKAVGSNGNGDVLLTMFIISVVAICRIV